MAYGKYLRDNRRRKINPKNPSWSGHPAPRFHSDNDRTFFEVELYMHPAFMGKIPLAIDLKKVKWDLEGIDELLSQLVENVDSGIAGGIAGRMLTKRWHFVVSFNVSLMSVVSSAKLAPNGQV